MKERILQIFALTHIEEAFVMLMLSEKADASESQDSDHSVSHFTAFTTGFEILFSHWAVSLIQNVEMA